jgi:hypothetical protein
MNYKERKIRDGLKRIASEHGPIQLFDGEVVNVDSTDYFIDVQLDTDASAVIPSVRLRACSIGNQSIDILPAMGSEVVIAKIAEDDYILIAADLITSYRVTVGSMILTVTADGFSITNGTTSLNDILSGFVTQMLAIYAPKDIAGIDNLQTMINGLLV